MYVDSHCHLSIPELAGQIDQVLERMRTAQVGAALNVCVTLEEFAQVQALAQAYPHIHASVGVHPDCQGGEEPTVARLLDLAQAPKVVAIGETGLDYYRLKEPLDWQRERFRVHIRAARACGKPLIIHTRAVPLDRLLIETDAPYLAPVPHRGKTNEPGFVPHVAAMIGRLRDVSSDEIARASSQNFYNLFNVLQ